MHLHISPTLPTGNGLIMDPGTGLTLGPPQSQLERELGATVRFVHGQTGHAVDAYLIMKKGLGPQGMAGSYGHGQ